VNGLAKRHGELHKKGNHMEKPVLSDANTYPSEEIILGFLGKSKEYWKEFGDMLNTSFPNLELCWNYYKDGSNWLCKVVNKKKTVFWLSVYDGYFKTAFYFTEKTGSNIRRLDIGKEIIDSYLKAKSFGKLKPLRIDIKSKKTIKDLKKVIEYKLES
jgi:hypothetical protein